VSCIAAPAADADADADNDNGRLSGNGEPGRARALAVRPWRDGEAAMGYVRAVRARARPAVRCGDDEEPFGG
jgi:hypothetical protein